MVLQVPRIFNLRDNKICVDIGAGKLRFRGKRTNSIFSDCNIGFRTHGVLAKHLRTKNHVKSLVQQGKLPDDALNLVKDNTGHLLEVDTNNCEQARLSLLSKRNTKFSTKINFLRNSGSFTQQSTRFKKRITWMFGTFDQLSTNRACYWNKSEACNHFPTSTKTNIDNRSQTQKQRTVNFYK